MMATTMRMPPKKGLMSKTMAGHMHYSLLSSASCAIFSFGIENWQMLHVGGINSLRKIIDILLRAILLS